VRAFGYKKRKGESLTFLFTMRVYKDYVNPDSFVRAFGYKKSKGESLTFLFTMRVHKDYLNPDFLA